VGQVEKRQLVAGQVVAGQVAAGQVAITPYVYRKTLEWKIWYFMTIWYILGLFGIVCGH
jgi:hypothetical protein